ncbi:MAG: 4Fe-4S dicluster domain-containing protein [Elusimicrobia bacterium]|nr:4Fe-4S dicluster domain-containing protein [Elusimicrobiota bacterium]
MAASLAMAGLGTACTRQPLEKIFPYSEAPERVIPGRPLFFATALTRQGAARGVLVESHLGRPTKVEGNPLHPDSLGSTDVFMQAEILNLYDPDRLRAVLNENRISGWSAFIADLRPRLDRLKQRRGAGLYILTETVTSPSMAALLNAVLAKFPEARWHSYEAAGRDGMRGGSELAFGRAVEPVYRFDRAERIFSLDADFLTAQPGSVRYTRDYAAGRSAADARRNRLYMIEPGPTVTGSMADHRWPVRAGDVENISDHLAHALGVSGATPSGEAPAWITAAARDLASRPGRSVVVPGEGQPARVHALAHAMNRQLRAIGATVDFIEPIEARPVSQMKSIAELQRDLEDNRVETLLVLGGNPVYAAPGDLNFADLFMRAGHRIYLGSHRDETARLCHWAIPQAHELESWGDAKAYDGTVSVQQPLIAPLYDGKSALEVLSLFADDAARASHDVVQDTWKKAWGLGFEDRWRHSVHDGVIPDTAHKPLNVVPKDPPAPAKNARTASRALEVALRPDPTIWDGRHANNGWLQELPKPVTTLTWVNAAMISAADAARNRLENGDVIELTTEGRKIDAPVWITPGVAEGAVVLTLGHGRRYGGRAAVGTGTDVNLLRGTAMPWFSESEWKKTRKTQALAAQQGHFKMEGRDPVKVAELGHIEPEPKPKEPPPSLLGAPPVPQSPDYAWAMSIDLNACVGCNACTIACQSENNIPVVGPDQVRRGREMHWIRVDRYERDDGDLVHQPVPCMQCENAPCEVVCPVGATTHSAEGLNDMTYNRCVGTRYCSNNCPYKVRRFNFYQFSDLETEPLKLMRNPDVSVRVRGVMEKCTYCVQRINEARIDAERENGKIPEGSFQTACQQVCPAKAIVFGNLKNPDSEVSKRREDPRHYALLPELNTKPRTTYLARVRNLNPEIKHG